MPGFIKGSKHSTEVRRVMSQKRKEFYRNGGKHPMKDKKFSDESKKKMSDSHIGKYVSSETRKKLSDMKKGSKHWNWKGGTNNRDVHSLYNPEYVDWRSKVLKRDLFKCRLANEKCLGGLQVHHILPWRDYPDMRYEISNGISLCHAHHPRKRAEEKRLVPLFKELVSVSR